MQVTRRKLPKGSAFHTPAGLGRSRLTKVSVAAAALVMTGASVGSASTLQFGTQQVGQQTKKGEVISSDQYINPIGTRLVIDQGKIMGATVSPDGTHMAATVADGTGSLVIIDLRSYQVEQVIGASAGVNLTISGNDVGQVAPTYSPDGTSLWLPRANGYTKFTVGFGGILSNPVDVAIPSVGSEQALSGRAVFSPDGSTVYAADNGQNKVLAINTTTDAIEQSWNTGVAPRDMVMVGGRLYVSNEGGRQPLDGDTTMNSYGSQVVANPQTGTSANGTVSVIDPANPTAAVGSINVGLHPTAVYASGKTIFVANTNSDTVSVIDSTKDKVVQTISTQPWPEATIGYEPTSISLTADGHLLVTLGRANTVAVYRYTSAQQPASYVGLLPTDYFPAYVATNGNQVVVANTRGIDALRPTVAAGHNTHDTTSSLTRFTLPSDQAIRGYTGKVFQYNGWTNNSVKYASTASAAKQKAVPVPAEIGAPSTIKHVFLIVKENRTYDQVFGDMPQGNGDPTLTQYGEAVTPNQHALADQFGLYDNFYDVGTNSAEGHNWLMQADDPEYTESSAGEYTRSYDTENDVLGHQESGFIWSGAAAAGKSVKDYGEFDSFETKPAAGTWQNYYCDTQQMAATGQPSQYPIQEGSAIPSLNAVTVPGFPQFDNSVPDTYKEQVWQQDFEKNGPANLNMFWLSNDHTGGTASPTAAVADNDLAVGQIVDTISHSQYWKDSAIFVVEDDSQAGLDHVDGHRAPVEIISPYSVHSTVNDQYYSQIMMVRTIEQMLGIHPMNQLDSAATPMYGAFTSTPNYTPFTAVPNQTSLTLGVSPQPSCGANVPAGQTTATVAKADVAATAVPAAEQSVAAQWKTWASQQRLTGPNAVPDYADPEQMNRYTYYQTTGWTKAYPGDKKIYAPNDVPGAFIPSADSEG
ncbi:bifunctional YncE family protein/alkaline phosphatase family protein [Actinospica sp.]|jgi:YVTN family beta-propeller protein|uniref:bifunctional YncE family protein/alkaline phosphatase family protein n=1 Tax=Actinospica sp. TaxID=1872142 RepID=UPI002C079F13|nr:bifunctional YncE family protein/alkaline phosphatase family protein [Actinospica sp.]HWG26088.1 bifunctional YncE family protein/alkaline phosphatase family protein [Actinospica sp.]